MRTERPSRADTLVERKAWELLEENRLLVRKLSYLVNIPKSQAFAICPSELLGLVIRWLPTANTAELFEVRALLIEYLPLSKANDFLELCSHSLSQPLPPITGEDLEFDYRFWGI